MKQYDIVRLGRSDTLAVILQHDGLYLLPTVFAAPLSEFGEFTHDFPKINPVIEHAGRKWYLRMEEMAAIRRDIVRETVGSVEVHHFDIMDAIDRLFSGV